MPTPKIMVTELAAFAATTTVADLYVAYRVAQEDTERLITEADLCDWSDEGWLSAEDAWYDTDDTDDYHAFLESIYSDPMEWSGDDADAAL